MEQEQTRQTGSEEAAPVHGAQGTRPRRTHTPRWALSVTVTLLCLALAAIVALGGLVWRLAAGVPASQPDAGGEKPVTMQLDDLPETADGGLTTAEIAQRVAPSVVSVHIYEQDSLAPSSMGSGVVLTQDGYIITNAHVVEGASGINVLFADGTEMDARIIGVDEKTDLAVIKVAGEGLVPAEFGDSGALAVGERAVAIGNAAGQFDGTVTQGVISGLDREVTVTVGGRDVTMSLIQTDAAINPGNSGGPTFNAAGQVIGINSSIASTAASSDSAGSIGIGFAIPSNLVKRVADEIIKDGKVKHVALGVVIKSDTVEADGVTRGGATITKSSATGSAVVSGGPADKAGLKEGDTIVAFNGNAVNNNYSLLGYVRAAALGDKVTLTIVRDGKTMDVDVTLDQEESSVNGSSSSDSNGNSQNKQNNQNGNGQNGYGNGNGNGNSDGGTGDGGGFSDPFGLW